MLYLKDINENVPYYELLSVYRQIQLPKLLSTSQWLDPLLKYVFGVMILQIKQKKRFWKIALCTFNRYRDISSRNLKCFLLLFSQNMDLETSSRKTKIWSTKDIMERGHPERYQQIDLEWTVEEAEVAAREWIMWRCPSTRVVSAVMHDDNQ